MIIKLNKLLATVLLTVCLVVLIPVTGCVYKDYSGKNPDLYTVAVNSVLWNEGHSSSADWFYDSEIEVLEEDSYGRIIYTYYEKIHGAVFFSSLIISQYSSDENVYYYEDYNYLIKEQEPYSDGLNGFEEEEIEYLKTVNDWGKELDLKNCTKKEIIRNKQYIPINEKSIREKACLEFSITGKDYISVRYLTSDANGNFIIYGNNSDRCILFTAFVNSEGDVIDWFVPDNFYNCQEGLKNFKQKNGWLKET